MEKVTYYQTLNRFSLFNAYFAFLDTEDYLADGLFIKHQLRVYFEIGRASCRERVSINV